MYSYDDIDEYIKKYMKDKGHLVDDGKDSDGNMDESKIKYGINLYFVLSTYRVLVELDDDFRLDLRNLDFRKLIGFDSKLIEKKRVWNKSP